MGRLENNLLSNDNESFDSSLGGWGVNAACTIARNTSTFISGPASMSLTTTAATGTYSAILVGTGVRQLTTYTVAFKAFTTLAGKSAQIGCDWYDAAGVVITFGVTFSQPLTQNAWTRVFSVLQAPANAVEARFSVGNVTSTGIGEVLFVDDVEFAVAGPVETFTSLPPMGPSPAWPVVPQPIAFPFPVQPTQIHQAVNTSSSPSGVTATIPITATAQHMLLALVIHLQSSSATVTSVTDSGGGTWLKAIDLSTAGSYTGVWYRDDVPAGLTSVIATMSVGTSYDASVTEWEGTAGLRGSASTAVTTSPNTTGPVAALAGDLIIGGISSNSATARTIVTPTSELIPGVLPASFTGSQGYLLPQADGSYSLDWTTGSASNTGGVVAVFANPSSPPSAGASPNAEVASGTGVANDASVSIQINAEAALGTGAAFDAVPALAANAEAALGTGAAFDATVAITVNADVALGTGAGLDAVAALTVNAEAALGTGVANDATVSTATATNAPAEAALGTGSAFDATVAITTNAEAALGTGTAFAAVAALGANAGAGLGTGSAFDSSAAVTVNAEAALGTGTSDDATVSTATAVTAPAEAALGTGSAFDATVALGPNAEAALGTGTALTASATITVNAEAALGTGAALDATAALGANAVLAVGSGSAFDASAAVAPNAEAALGTGTAFDATVSTVPTTNAPAEAALGVGSAFDATVAITFTAGVATGTGTAADAIAAIGVTPAAALGTGTVFQPSIAITFTAGVATGIGQAFDASASYDLATQIPGNPTTSGDTVYRRLTGDTVSGHVDARELVAAVSGDTTTRTVSGDTTPPRVD